jgi:predicted alpha-1,6-mannanase (GH76 family)
MNRLTLTTLLFAVLLGSAGAPAARGVERAELDAAIEKAGRTHQESRRFLLRDWPRSTWWTQSHNIDGLLRFDPELIGSLDQTYFFLSFRPILNYVNGIFDDEGWWALTWLHAYEASGRTKKKYLKRTLALYKHIHERAWVPTCGGSLVWKPENKYQNSVTNGIYAVLNLRLFELTGDPAYRERALQIVHWIENSAIVRNPEGLIDDGLDARCNAIGDYWTYNQGLYIEVFTRLGNLDRAWSLFQASRNYFINERGAFHERHCESEGGKKPCGVDGVTFKGIFMKSLYPLARAFAAKSDPRFEELRSFADRQAELVIRSPKNKCGWYPLRWVTPEAPGQFTPVTHIVALETLLFARFMDDLN